MTPTRAPSPETERLHVGAAAVYVLTHPWEVFITDWNWKTALLSVIFRVAIWPTMKAAGVRLVSPGALRGLLIEFAYRLAIGGFWGSLLQAFAGARPAWLAGVCMIVLLPGCAHWFEYLVLQMGGAAHAGAITFASIVFSVLSLLVNWGLMRRGILLTGQHGSSLTADLRRIFGAMMNRGSWQAIPWEMRRPNLKSPAQLTHGSSENVPAGTSGPPGKSSRDESRYVYNAHL